jgi:nucleoside-diphosphate-sugar epimerase
VKVLIIGGTGLISSAVVQRLIDRGDRVTAFNRGLESRSLPPGVDRIAGDRSDSPRFERQVAESGPWDVVIDMICYKPAEADSAIRAVRGNTSQYIMTSTIDVYAKPAARYPYREDEPHAGIGAYAVDKAACEEILWAASARGDLPLTIIRPAATYGDGHLPVHTLGRSTTYLDRLRKGKPIVVHGDGSSFWVSCHAFDVAGAFVGAAGNGHALGKSYHVTGEEWLTWNEHHRVVAESIGAPEPALVHIPTDILATLAPDRATLVVENFQFNNIFDNSAARADLGFDYTIPLRAGLPGWYHSLEATGRIEDSDGDPFEDHLIETWRRLVGSVAANLT